MKPENEQQHNATTGELTDELKLNQSELGDIPSVPSVEEELSEEQLEGAAGGTFYPDPSQARRPGQKGLILIR